MYRELLTQGDVFTMDSLITKFRVKREANFNWEDGVNIKKFKVKEELELEYKRPEATMLSGTKVYLGNIREPLIQNQPFVVVVETESYDVVRTQFQKWERWKYVPQRILRLQDSTDVSGYRDWTMMTTKDKYCEKIWYMDRPSNILQLYLNGVPMLPVGFPLEEISPSGLYPIAQGSCEKIPFFAYSKGIAEKMKVDQAIIDEFMKLAILKQQQAYRPTLANNSGSELSPDIYTAGSVIDNIDPEKVKPIFTPAGMDQSDVAFMQYMKEIMDAKSISPVMTGEKTGQGRMTAAQYLDQKRQSLQKLGLIVWGIVKFEQHTNWLRLQNILKYGLGDGFSDGFILNVKTTLENGKKGQRVFEFSGDKTNRVSGNQIRLESELLTARYGMETRKVYLNWEGIQKANVTWRVNVVPTEKIRDAAELFGPQSMQLGYWEELWAMKNEVDFAKAFNQTPQMAGMGGILGGQPQQGNKAGTPNLGNVGPQAVINNEHPALREVK
jgi:hypothetical protein